MSEQCECDECDECDVLVDTKCRFEWGTGMWAYKAICELDKDHEGVHIDYHGDSYP